jgi:ABC-type transporter Mla maintaining outer membrane lipid asymmetry ATPase subunit MlaF
MEPNANINTPGPANAEAGAPALEMAGVTVGSLKHAGRVMLEEVNWTVRSGDFWMIGGLQASGKSDLLSTAVGLMPPLSGTMRVFGEDLAGYEHQRRALRMRIGLVWDGGRLLRQLSVLENILLPLRYHFKSTPAELEETARVLLEFTGLTHHAHSPPETLGLNWQQRIGLARALVLKPEVLLLDNPLSGLDPVHSQWWLRTLDQLAAGHPIAGGRPLTLVATGDDFQPWRNHARQYALLKEKRFMLVQAGADGKFPGSALTELLAQDL